MAMSGEADHKVLCIDIGNTLTHIGLFRGERIVGHWKISSRGSRTGDEYWICLQSFLASVQVDSVDGVVVASVVPRLMQIYLELFREHLDLEPVRVTGEMEFGIRICVDSPGEVGGDRIANSVAASAIYNRDIIVVDLGTATTFDVVSREKKYLGGVIAPGIETSAARLSERTAKLPQVEIRPTERVIGTNTEDAIRSGLFYGAISQIDGVVRRIIAEWGRTPLVVATGGLAGIVVPTSETITEADPYLTLKGLRIIHAQRNSG
jgi:type III pantothenate kinase